MTSKKCIINREGCHQNLTFYSKLQKTARRETEGGEEESLHHFSTKNTASAAQFSLFASYFFHTCVFSRVIMPSQKRAKLAFKALREESQKGGEKEQFKSKFYIQISTPRCGILLLWWRKPFLQHERCRTISGGIMGPRNKRLTRHSMEHGNRPFIEFSA